MMNKNAHAVALGRLGGKARSEAKAKASRENGGRGGRPKLLSEALDAFGIPEPILEMANLGPKLTGGLPKLIHIWHQGEDRKISHGPRVKASFFQNRFDPIKNVSISVSDDPQIIAPKNFKFSSEFTRKDFEAVAEWIRKRKTKLERYWVDSTISLDDVLSDD